MTDQTEETKISSQTEIASSAVEKLSGWGRVFRPGRQVFSSDLEEASREAVLFRGMGRSYGDSALPPPNRPEVVATPLADRIRFYDRDTGVIRAEAGLTLVKLNRLFLNEGYFVPVTPGTQYVTLGGMVAADVHGKNHHVDGTFGAHIRALKMRVADGSIVECTPENEPDLFRATVGGMGLTGHILEVEFAMKKISSPWIWQEARRIGNLEDFVQALKESAREWPFTVGWIDCLTRGRSMGRGILLCGRWAEPEEAPDRPVTFKDPLPVPLVFPEFVLNKLSVKAFNLLYYRKQFRKIKRGIVNPISFFYPLDILSDWNKLYGPRGFTQHQCVLPEHERPGATRRFFDLLTAKGATSFLSVIKDCGAEGRGLLSFPKSGISIAVDIPVRDNTQEIIDSLNELVVAEGGRINLCKDTFTRREHYRKMEPRFEEWLAIRRKWDPDCKIRSAQSIRLLGDGP